MAGISLSIGAVKAWADKADASLRALPSVIRNSPLDARIAYACVLAGIAFVLIGFMLLLIL